VSRQKLAVIACGTCELLSFYADSSEIIPEASRAGALDHYVHESEDDQDKKMPTR